MRIPIATYRLQFSPSFRFQDAETLIPYLRQLGISDIYASPILKATPGSAHGYDVTNPDELNPELGTRADFEALTTERLAHQMGWVQDIVPNHMAYSSENQMLMDVFENGPRSEYHDYFDVFRDHPDPELRSRVLAPFLGGSLEEALASGEITLALDQNGLAIRYHQWRFPVRLQSYGAILRHGIEPLRPHRSEDQSDLNGLTELCDTFARLSRMDACPEKRRQLAEAKKALCTWYHEDPAVRSCIDGTLSSFNHHDGKSGEPGPLRQLLEQQFFKPAFWQTAAGKINYRRFFYLNDFIALRIEKPEVFDRVHKHLFTLVLGGFLTGLRIDHIDGLYNPTSYLIQLRDRLREAYIVAEKILEPEESLPTSWPIQGTSGYEFCNHVNGIFCQPENERALTRMYHEFIGAEPDYAQLRYDAKREILSEHMAGEVTYLAHLSMRASQGGPYTVEPAQEALTALIAAFPVYRTYIDDEHATDQDRTYLSAAVRDAKEKACGSQKEIDRIGSLLLSYPQKDPDLQTQEAQRDFVMRFQQFTGPAMAKGIEDTLLYTYNRLISLNEVGGDPGSLGISRARFHGFNQRRARHWPQAMNTTSTHDTKRGEDVRARINVLSEIPERWRRKVTQWTQMNERHKLRRGDALAPDRNDEYLLYQTLVGALPFAEDEYDRFKQRVGEYIVKAVREAKRHSTWTQPDEQYEGACLRFIDRIIDRSTDNPFGADFLAFQREVSEYGIYNSLSQTTLKMTCPGLPDFYQGAELWDLNLVDPDNRRGVDFEKRTRFLKEIRETPANAVNQLLHKLMTSKEDGRIKLFLIHKGLHARAQNKALFQTGDYLPAFASGKRADHVVAFFRVYGNRFALIVVPRFLTSLIRPDESPLGRPVWEDTTIHLLAGVPSRWRDALTGDTVQAANEVPVGDILTACPVSVLLSRSGRHRP